MQTRSIGFDHSIPGPTRSPSCSTAWVSWVCTQSSEHVNTWYITGNCNSTRFTCSERPLSNVVGGPYTLCLQAHKTGALVAAFCIYARHATGTSSQSASIATANVEGVARPSQPGQKQSSKEDPHRPAAEPRHRHTAVGPNSGGRGATATNSRWRRGPPFSKKLLLASPSRTAAVAGALRA